MFSEVHFSTGLMGKKRSGRVAGPTAGKPGFFDIRTNDGNTTSVRADKLEVVNARARLDQTLDQNSALTNRLIGQNAQALGQPVAPTPVAVPAPAPAPALAVPTPSTVDRLSPGDVIQSYDATGKPVRLTVNGMAGGTLTATDEAGTQHTIPVPAGTPVQVVKKA
jgi:hypothetical protein